MSDEQHGQVTLDEITLDTELLGAGYTASEDVAEYVMRLGDDALILSQQLGEWVARGPELEEDMALANITLDLLGHARALLQYAGSASGRTEDELAYFRDEPEFRCCWLVQQPNGHFGDTIARQFFFSAYQVELYSALAGSDDEALAAISARALREVRYHLDHAAQWILRLAGGTEESRAKILQSVLDMWPYVEELFTDDALTEKLAPDTVPLPSSLRGGFDEVVEQVFTAADIDIPALPPAAGGGREGRHSTLLGHILPGMQHLARQFPGAKW